MVPRSNVNIENIDYEYKTLVNSGANSITVQIYVPSPVKKSTNKKSYFNILHTHEHTTVHFLKRNYWKNSVKQIFINSTKKRILMTDFEP